VSEDEIAMINDAVELGIEAACEATIGWDQRDYKIAETAAREAIAALRQMEAGK
jgi:hypothetical protein